MPGASVAYSPTTIGEMRDLMARKGTDSVILKAIEEHPDYKPPRRVDIYNPALRNRPVSDVRLTPEQDRAVCDYIDFLLRSWRTPRPESIAEYAILQIKDETNPVDLDIRWIDRWLKEHTNYEKRTVKGVITIARRFPDTKYASWEESAAQTSELIDLLNATPLDLQRRYWIPDPLELQRRAWVLKPDQARPMSQTLHLSLESATSINPEDLETCFQLVSTTSKEDYKRSSWGWVPAKKKKEMKLLDLRYLLVRDLGDTSSTDASTQPQGERGKIIAFLSFMFTIEDLQEVIYCYEVHTAPAYQGQGIGKHLMELFNVIGCASGLTKAMLTVFTANTRARDLYYRLGYGVDSYSPKPIRLRNDKRKEPDYMIMSKLLNVRQITAKKTGSGVKRGAPGPSNAQVRKRAKQNKDKDG